MVFTDSISQQSLAESMQQGRLTLFLIMVAYLSGSLMFSYWLGMWHDKDMTAFGDGNPGGFNLWQVAGYKFGLTGIALDFGKGFVPMYFMMRGGLLDFEAYSFVLIALAPIVGHAFSPFLRFHGGKAIAVTFGVWSALTFFEVSLVYAVSLAMMLLVSYVIDKESAMSSSTSSFQVVSSMLIVCVYVYWRGFPTPLLLLALANNLLLLYTHRAELRHFIRKIV